MVIVVVALIVKAIKAMARETKSTPGQPSSPGPTPSRRPGASPEDELRRFLAGLTGNSLRRHLRRARWPRRAR